MPKDDDAAGLLLLGLAAAAIAGYLAAREARKVPQSLRCPICGGYFASKAVPGAKKAFTFCPYCSRMVFADVV